MSSEKLDLTPLDKAVFRLQEGWMRYQIDISDTQIRDGLIQRFEFTYEISHKMLKRHLEATSASSAEIDGMNFQDLIRTGNERNLLLGDWPKWKVYREMRAQVGSENRRQHGDRRHPTGDTEPARVHVRRAL